jgi:hypothetical protein
MFMWNEAQGHKGDNEVISCLNKYIKNTLIEDVGTL